MVRKILGIFFVFIGINSNANKNQDSLTLGQEYIKIDEEVRNIVPEYGFTHPGLFLFRASIAVGGLTKLNAGTVFFEGNTEYFLDRRVSLRGDVYFFGGHTGDYKPFKMHHSLLTGAMFHKYTKGDFDPYAGLEVGINYAQATDPYLGGIGSAVLPVEPVTKVVSPTFSPVLGFNYYGGKFFHLTMHARYIFGTFMDNYNVASLGEWRISFGLGFNISKKLISKDTSTASHF